MHLALTPSTLPLPAESLRKNEDENGHEGNRKPWDEFMSTFYQPAFGISAAVAIRTNSWFGRRKKNMNRPALNRLTLIMLHDDGKLQLSNGRINPPILNIGRPSRYYRRWSQSLAANRS
jgi:hypothetical protein